MMTNSEDRIFVDALKEGDKVFVLTLSHSTNLLTLKTVKRITKTNVVIDRNGSEQKFRKDNLKEVGRKFGRMYMGDPHDEIVEYKEPRISKYKRQLKEVMCAKIIKWLGEKKLKDLPEETLDAYHVILLQFEKKESEEGK